MVGGNTREDEQKQAKKTKEGQSVSKEGKTKTKNMVSWKSSEKTNFKGRM